MEDLEDFTYLVEVDGLKPAHLREVRPKDFYFAQTLRNRGEGYMSLLCRLILNPDDLSEWTVTQTQTMLNWAAENLLTEKVFTVESWLQTAFYLCKRQWNSSMDWLEEQPMSKILAMIDVVQADAQRQEDAMKKSARKRK